MNLHPLTGLYRVSAQIDPSDTMALAQMGVHTLICNRPDSEVEAPHQSLAMQAAAEVAGLRFVDNPIVPGQMSEDHVTRQATALAQATGPVVAYCATGNRSTIVWALGTVGTLTPQEIVARASAQGYDLSGVLPELERRAALLG